MLVLLIVVSLLGLAVGSFLNVVIYRVPAGKSIVAPPSACPHCGAGIRKRDNIPVLSWLILRAKCRDCGAPISARYPLVELGTAVLFVLIGLLWAPAIVDSTTAPQLVAALLALIAFLYLGAISVALALIDIDTRRLPDVIVLPSYIVGAVLLATSSLLSGNPSQLIWAGVGLAASFVFYLILAFAYTGGMGMGDVKLSGVLGLYLGWIGLGTLAVGSFLPFFIGGLFSIALLVLRKANRKSRIPFGPWMLLGALVAIFFGDAIFELYLRQFGLA